MTQTFTCWHGEEHDRYDSRDMEATSPDRAAAEFALYHDEGDETDVVYVLVGSLVHEYKCKFKRETTCAARRVATYPTEV